MQDKINNLLSQIQEGDIKSLARAITIVENELEGYKELLLSLKDTTDAKVIGVTGPPGAGKSTLVNVLLQHWVAQDKKIAVIAVDPSSPFNYGALLGDRIRMSGFYNHPNVFIRSLASRGVLGGLNAKIIEITDLVKIAKFDYLIIETIGVGQSEVEIAGLADCTVVTLVPESGDEVQMLKAGIMEIANIFVVNKGDRENAETLYRNLKILVHEKADSEGNEIPVLKTVALNNEGIKELAISIEKHLSETSSINDKKIHLLTEKAWQLINKERMKGLSKRAIYKEITMLLHKGNLNLYDYISRYTS